MNISTFLSKWNTIFADNSTRDISEADLREFRSDITLTFLGREDDVYTSFAVTTAGTGAYTATLNPSITTYLNLSRYFVKFADASTSAVTLNLSSVGAKKVFIDSTTQAGSGDIPANFIGILVYDSSLDSAAGGFLILNSPVIDGGVL